MLCGGLNDLGGSPPTGNGSEPGFQDLLSGNPISLPQVGIDFQHRTLSAITLRLLLSGGALSIIDFFSLFLFSQVRNDTTNATFSNTLTTHSHLPTPRQQISEAFPAHTHTHTHIRQLYTPGSRWRHCGRGTPTSLRPSRCGPSQAHSEPPSASSGKT